MMDAQEICAEKPKLPVAAAPKEIVEAPTRPPFAWTQQLGNLSQMISALAACITCCAAIYGVWTFSPIAQNAVLRENVADLTSQQRALNANLASSRQALEQLRLALKSSRQAIWTLACAAIGQQIEDDLEYVQEAPIRPLYSSPLTLRNFLEGALTETAIFNLPSDLKAPFRARFRDFLVAAANEYPLDEVIARSTSLLESPEQSAAERQSLDAAHRRMQGITEMFYIYCKEGAPAE
jgi:hypothetical protein